MRICGGYAGRRNRRNIEDTGEEKIDFEAGTSIDEAIPQDFISRPGIAGRDKVESEVKRHELAFECFYLPGSGET